jgi:hypothetical protein
VGVAQLVERLVVVQVVAGSSPVTHPTRFQRVRHCSKITGKLGAACIWLSDSLLIMWRAQRECLHSCGLRSPGGRRASHR